MIIKYTSLDAIKAAVESGTIVYCGSDDCRLEFDADWCLCYVIDGRWAGYVRNINLNVNDCYSH
jgi:hypothetical protein